jgi:DTW domain-containing protein
VLSSLAMRATCRRCLRPAPFCVCAGLGPIPSRIRVVLLQHPREARLAICSARLTRVALENAELHRAVALDAHPRVRALLDAPGTALLFPGEGAPLAAALADEPPRTLVVLDATWLQAAKMLDANPRLAALPRISVAPGRPSGYRDLRREPAEGHLSTIEAVALALGALERDPPRFAPMVAAFERMVELQLGCARGDLRRPRHRSPRPRAA